MTKVDLTNLSKGFGTGTTSNRIKDENPIVVPAPEPKKPETQKNAEAKEVLTAARIRAEFKSAVRIYCVTHDVTERDLIIDLVAEKIGYTGPTK